MFFIIVPMLVVVVVGLSFVAVYATKGSMVSTLAKQAGKSYEPSSKKIYGATVAGLAIAFTLFGLDIFWTFTGEGTPLGSLLRLGTAFAIAVVCFIATLVNLFFVAAPSAAKIGEKLSPREKRWLFTRVKRLWRKSREW